MADMERQQERLVPLTPAEFSILLELAVTEQHGYRLLVAIADRDRQLRIAPATLYRSIKRLLQAHLIEESVDRPDLEIDDERRRYYRITEYGIQAAMAEAQRLEALVNAARAAQLL